MNDTTKAIAPNATVTGAVISFANAAARLDGAKASVSTRLYALLLAKPAGFASDSAYAAWLVETAKADGFKYDPAKANPNPAIAKYTPGSLRSAMLRARRDAKTLGFEGDPNAWSKAIAEQVTTATASRKPAESSSSKPGKPRTTTTTKQRQTAAQVIKQAGTRELFPQIVDRLAQEADAIAKGAAPKPGTKARGEYNDRHAAMLRQALLTAKAAGVDVEAIVADVLAS